MRTACLVIALLVSSCVEASAQTCPSCTGSKSVVEDSASGVVAPVTKWAFDPTGAFLTGANGTTVGLGTGPTGITEPVKIQNASQAYLTGVAAKVNALCVGQGCAPILPNIFSALVLFGDSAGCGYDASPLATGGAEGQFGSPNGFAFLMAPDFGGIFQNYCFVEDMSEDLVREWEMPYVEPTDQRNPTYVIEVGGNDAIQCLLGTNCVSDFTYAVQAAVAWLAIPSSCKVYGQATAASTGLACGSIGPPTLSGSWSNDNFTVPSTNYGNAGGGYRTQPTITGVAEYTETSGSTLSIPITTTVPGQNVYCAWRVQLGADTASATFAIDGANRDTWRSNFVLGPLTSTGNHTTDTIFANYYPVTAAGNHTLLITASAASGEPFSFVWCGIAPQVSFEAGQPRVIMTGVAVGPGGPPPSTTLAYDTAAQEVATTFSQDGLQVSIAQARSYLVTTDYAGGADHPNSFGHQHIRDAYEAAAINGFYQSRVYAPVARSCGSFTSTNPGADTFACPFVTPTSKCSVEPTNSIGGGMVAGMYVSSKTFGSLTLTHGATTGGTFNIVCSMD